MTWERLQLCLTEVVSPNGKKVMLDATTPLRSGIFEDSTGQKYHVADGIISTYIRKDRDDQDIVLRKGINPSWSMNGLRVRRM